MEALIIRSSSKKTIRLIQELSKEIGAEYKKLTAREMEDLYLGESMKKGLRTRNISRKKIIKQLQK